MRSEYGGPLTDSMRRAESPGFDRFVRKSKWCRPDVNHRLLPKSVVVVNLYAYDDAPGIGGASMGPDFWLWTEVEKVESVLEAWRFDSIEEYVYGVVSAPGAMDLTLFSIDDEGLGDLNGAAFEDVAIVFVEYIGQDVSWRVQPLEDDWIFIRLTHRGYGHQDFICDGFRGMEDAVFHIRSGPHA